MLKHKEIINELRIAIIVLSDNIPSWAYLMLEKIKKENKSKIVLKVKNTIESNWRENYVFNKYEVFDKKKYGTNNDALAKKNINELIIVPSLDIDDHDKILEKKIDLFINLDLLKPPHSIFDLARYGVWSLHIGDLVNNNGKSQFFYDVIHGKGYIDISLLLHSKKSCNLLANSKSPTDKISVYRCMNICLWKMASIIPRAVNELSRLGEKEFFLKKEKLDNTALFKDTFKPNSFVFSLMLLKFNWKRFLNICKNLFYFDQWILLFKIENNKIRTKDFSRFTQILPPKDRFWADPHIIKEKDTYFIFIEELIFKENKGFISVIEMDDKGNYLEPVVILKKDYHLSFPFIFKEKEDFYMIPESSQNRSIDLYKCIDFPYKWECVKTILKDINAADTIIILKDHKYWMFTNIVENKGASKYDELFLFYADSLMSDNWISHPENPIVSDVQNARMAGKIFFENGKMYRPSQNCSNHYGYGMSINEIIELNEKTYKEVKLESIDPNWSKKIKSTHSFSTVEGLTVIDAEYRRKK